MFTLKEEFIFAISKLSGIRVSNSERPLAHPSSLSSILTHKRETGHAISFEDISVLASGRSELDTLIRESLLIAKISPSVSVNIRSFPLMLFCFLFPSP